MMRPVVGSRPPQKLSGSSEPQRRASRRAGRERRPPKPRGSQPHHPAGARRGDAFGERAESHARRRDCPARNRRICLNWSSPRLGLAHQRGDIGAGVDDERDAGCAELSSQPRARSASSVERLVLTQTSTPGRAPRSIGIRRANSAIEKCGVPSVTAASGAPSGDRRRLRAASRRSSAARRTIRSGARPPKAASRSALRASGRSHETAQPRPMMPRRRPGPSDRPRWWSRAGRDRRYSAAEAADQMADGDAGQFRAVPVRRDRGDLHQHARASRFASTCKPNSGARPVIAQQRSMKSP